MYTIVILEGEFIKIREASQKFGSIRNKLELLSANPISRGIPTDIPIIGNYYINCGRHAILFDIDEEEQKVIIYRIVLRAYLHKILSGRLDP